MNNQPMTRTDALYDYMTRRRGEWVKQRDVYQALPGLYTPAGAGDFHASTARRQMSADIQTINVSSKYPEIIIHGDEGIKIAEVAEAARYVRSRSNEAVRTLAQVSAMKRKLAAGIQFRIDEEEI